MKFLTALVGLLILGTVANGAPPRVEEDSRTCVLDNSVIRLTVSKQDAQMTSIKRYRADGTLQELGSGRESMYWDCNTEPVVVPDGMTAPKKGYARLSPIKSVSARLIDQDRAEIIVIGGPNRWMTFEVEFHWVLFSGDSGWYSYVVIRHAKDQPAMTFWQTRFVIKAIADATFTTQVTGEDRSTSVPRGQAVAKLMDATYLMPDGTINTKYSNSVYWAEAPVYGMLGNEVGLWNLSSSFEYHNGGPVKQGQTVHDTTLLRVLQSVHFGAAPVRVSAGEEWSKVYGPFFTYVNSAGTPEAMLKDAVARQKIEKAKWPYAWVSAPEYAKARGTVTGRWQLDGANPKIGAMVVLAEPGGDWPMQGKRYEFWARTGTDGAFNIPNVVPGDYALYIYGADQPDQFERAGIQVKAGQTLELGNIEWKPVTDAKTVWQIGSFDRTSTEFRDGADSRQYQPFQRYPKSFPNDVDFTIGKSDPAKDWNYAQWIWYSKTPEWTIRFAAPPERSGRATLIFGVSSAQPMTGERTKLSVKVNGAPVGVIAIGKTGTSGYRGGAADSQYNVIRIPFDAAMLCDGENTITLAHDDAKPFSDLKLPDASAAAASTEEPTAGFKVGHVMYDAIRLDIAP